MKVKPQTLKGFRDFLPKDLRKREYTLNTLKKVFTSYGFEPLETPSLEYEEILTGKYGEDADKLMYRFVDNGGRKVALRYDQTVPLARVIGQYKNDIIFPFKRYQIQNVWRAENTQKGRYREFLQIDIDTVGSSSSVSDAEIIALAIRSFESLGFKNFKMLINDRLVFDEISNILFPKEKLGAVIRVLDKIEKLGENGVLAELNELVGNEAATNIMQMLRNLKPTKKIETCFETLKKMGVDPARYEFSPTLARGLDYYTGLIFEIKDEKYEAGSLGGGGRYDDLMGLFSDTKIPAVGFSFGFDRMINGMEEQTLFPQTIKASKILVTNTSDKAFEAVNELRKAGINVELYIDEKDLDKQLRYADKNEIPFVLIVGETITLKDMRSGEQRIVELNSLADLLV